MSTPLILASGSPRRKQLLKQLGLTFHVDKPNTDESLPSFIAPKVAVQRLASQKAEAIAKQQEKALVIGADTVVVCDNAILGKPKNPRHACQMLQQLQSGAHEVYTGIALIEVQNGQIQHQITDAKRTTVWMNALSMQQIEQYVATDEPMDKAGAYGIQGIGSAFIDRIDGCYFNVVGLSLSLLNHMMNQMGYALFQFQRKG